MVDVLSQLPPFSWRGKQYPTKSSTYGFRHEDAEQKISLASLTLVQAGGARNPSFRYNLALLQGLQGIGEGEAFGLIRQLSDDTLDKSSGPLVDPVWGEWTCKPVSFETNVQASIRNGSYATAEFIWTPSIDEALPREGGVLSVEQLASDGQSFDRTSAETFRKYEEPYPGPSTTPLALVSGLGNQIDRQIGRLDYALTAMIYDLQKVERAAVKLHKRVTEPDTLQVIREARKLRLQTHRTQRDGGGKTPTLIDVVITVRTHVLNIAAKYGMTFPEFIELNSQLTNPLVEPGTKVRVYATPP